jgi:GntR family transcriptional regulator
MVEWQGLAGSATLPTSMPYYREIMDDIRRQIASGELQPGQRLPTTKELAETYHVGKTTVRQAIDRLLDAGDLTGHQGVGVHVSLPAKPDSV